MSIAISLRDLGLQWCLTYDIYSITDRGKLDLIKSNNFCAPNKVKRNQGIGNIFNLFI
jgi:hypothetical protein